MKARVSYSAAEDSIMTGMIASTADDLGAGRDKYYGYGLIDPVEALNYIP